MNDRRTNLQSTSNTVCPSIIFGRSFPRKLSFYPPTRVKCAKLVADRRQF